jgi:hypothetical protein
MNYKKFILAVIILAVLLSTGIASKQHRTALADSFPQTAFNATPLVNPIVSSWSISPWAAPADGITQVILLATVNDPDGDLAEVTVDLTALGGEATAGLYDDGVHSDRDAHDGIYGLVIVMPTGVPTGEIPLILTAIDSLDQQTVVNLGTFALLTPTNAPWPATLPAHMGWGTGEDDWQEATGLPWDYINRYLTWNWQDWNPNFVENYVQSAWENSEVPVLSLDMLLGADDCGNLSGKDCTFAFLQDATIMQGYFSRVTEAAVQASGSQPVIFQFDADVTGYMQRYSIENEGEYGIVADDPDTIPAQSLDPSYPDTFSGVIQRLVDIIHTQAPNALVALHARSWATGIDVAGDTDPDLNVAEIGRRIAYFLTKAGGADLDLLLADWKMLDAGSGYSPWWDNTNRVLPHFSRILYWQNQIVYHSDLSLILWQVPAGNMNLDNTCQHYQDNRVDYAFEHPSDLLSAGIIGVIVGGGDDCRTIPSTDGGNIFNKGTIFFTQPSAPVSFTAVAMDSPGLVRLSWQAGAEFDVIRYEIYVGRSPNNMNEFLNVQRQTSLELLLSYAGTWYVSVTAVDAYGLESPLADPVMVQLIDAPFKLMLPMVVH